MVRAGLTGTIAEWGMSRAGAQDFLSQKLRPALDGHVGALRDTLGAHWQPFDPAAIHPFLDWRGNLLFAGAEAVNQRQRRELDAALVRLMASGRWKGLFVAEGLNFQVGRNGARLSGGQGQLVALGRVLLRRSPIVVLDEPTSALDPSSRDRIAGFLNGWKDGRVIITVSHDPGFASMADGILVLCNGRVAGRGTYELLLKDCEPFRQIFKGM
jgi:ABC-type multidrug transport system fused ATPase/permease subunit